ncbi:hypothetical protein [Promicromonospora sp. NPDC057488]|uniref:hypothetical protein n=1 Tax=Promicromonospora sp. NPDC057488 TaxID=3346147 RepID=UPI003670E3DC
MKRVGDQNEMLAGRSAAEFFRLSRRLALLIAPAIVITAVLMLVLGDSFAGSVAFGIAVVVVLALVVVAGLAQSKAKFKEAREFYAGYTTLRGVHPAVDQVDPRSGRVIRVAGEPFLTRDEHDSRTALVRQARSDA